MTDLTPALLPAIEKHRLPGLDLDADFIYPKYDGDSILNIPSSICRWLNVPGLGAGALRPEILQPPGEGIRKVLLILMDALALHRFQRWLDENRNPVWNTLLQSGNLAPLTSISPSTTCAATTSLWTGASAAEHGIAGYELWLKEYGMVANMILHTPMAFRRGVGELAKAGFNASEYLPMTTLGEHLSTHGVQPYAFLHHSIAHSGLSTMQMRAVEVAPFSTPVDLWVTMRELFEEKARQRLYTWAYWGVVDGFSHQYQPEDERVSAEFTQFSEAFERHFLNQLSAAARQDTLVLLTADHGQIRTFDQGRYHLKNHPELDAMLHIRPTGENRLIYLYAKPGQKEAIRQYFEAAWPDEFAVFPPERALAAGLFGPGLEHPLLRDRLGDLIVIPRDNAYLWWADKPNPLIGRHGGLHREEMLVPFLAARLG
mgnify:CR=1 FL=1